MAYIFAGGLIFGYADILNTANRFVLPTRIAAGTAVLLPALYFCTELLAMTLAGIGGFSCAISTTEQRQRCY